MDFSSWGHKGLDKTKKRGFPGGAAREAADGEDPQEESMATLPVFLPGESHGQRSLAGYMGSQRVGQY